jgi:hypothetical protein
MFPWRANMQKCGVSQLIHYFPPMCSEKEDAKKEKRYRDPEVLKSCPQWFPKLSSSILYLFLPIALNTEILSLNLETKEF